MPPSEPVAVARSDAAAAAASASTPRCAWERTAASLVAERGRNTPFGRSSSAAAAWKLCCAWVVRARQEVVSDAAAREGRFMRTPYRLAGVRWCSPQEPEDPIDGAIMLGGRNADEIRNAPHAPHIPRRGDLPRSTGAA